MNDKNDTTMPIKTISLVPLSIILQSCNSQNEDLANLKFPSSKEEILCVNSDLKKEQITMR